MMFDLDDLKVVFFGQFGVGVRQQMFFLKMNGDLFGMVRKSDPFKGEGES